MAKRLSKEEFKEARREEQRQMLENAVNALTSEDGWKRYLRARASFRKYSFNNVILIALQCPHATMVAGYNKWQKEFERTVVPGQKAIKILAPNIVYEKDDKGAIVIDGNGRKVIRAIWYRIVNVFDVSQTEGAPMPEPTQPQPIDGDSHEEYLLRTEQFIESLGASVSHEGVEFYWTDGSQSESGKLTAHVASDAPVNTQVRDMVRAAAAIVGTDHAAGYEEPLTPVQQEVVIESAAYLVCQSIALDTAAMSVPYIANWSLEDDKALKYLKEFAGKIDALAEAITEAIS